MKSIVGKYLLFRMENNSILLNSLGMSGRWTLTGEKYPLLQELLLTGCYRDWGWTA